MFRARSTWLGGRARRVVRRSRAFWLSGGRARRDCGCCLAACALSRSDRAVAAGTRSDHRALAARVCAEVYALDYRPDGGAFAASGKDPAIKLIDENTRNVVSRMKGNAGYGVSSAAGHSNRVFSVKWHPDDPNVVLSAGWDNTIQIWDVRQEHAARSIYGPHVCGDALDYSNGMILSGSWRADEQLQARLSPRRDDGGRTTSDDE